MTVPVGAVIAILSRSDTLLASTGAIPDGGSLHRDLF
jgi:hypothetical protein